MSNPIIVVTSYKKSGKYYNRCETPLKDEHYYRCLCKENEERVVDETEGIDATKSGINYTRTNHLMDNIRIDHSSVKDYSGLSCGFGGAFFYTIEILFPDDETGFCLFHIDNTIG